MNCCRLRLLVEAWLCKSPLSSDWIPNAAGLGLKKEGSLRRKSALILCRARSRRVAMAGGKLISADVLSGSGRCLQNVSVREETKMGALESAPPPREGNLNVGCETAGEFSSDLDSLLLLLPLAELRTEAGTRRSFLFWALS